MFQKVNYYLVPMLVLCARAVILGASVGDAIAICGLAALNGYLAYLKSKEQAPISEQLRLELADMKSTLTALKIAKSIGR